MTTRAETDAAPVVPEPLPPDDAEAQSTVKSYFDSDENVPGDEFARDTSCGAVPSAARWAISATDSPTATRTAARRGRQS